MDITNDFKDEILNLTKSIENIEVVYKKKDKYSGTLASVKQSPFQITILDDNHKEETEHTIDFELAEEITIKLFDGTIKTFKDAVA
ncbi:hypothetical protein DRF62_11365 [Chryseobacterium piscium]|uniref:Uncharacterized protein n=1 Tax=Chryseobacterium piscium TaxID=333702 RepID=A0A3D9BKT1_9FLAO|nr:hypothetical protein [Chryseobacterium piscium]REC54012.1 hypothetical protein DRF62_11365 [Chryseobacterium piscium]